MIIFSQDGGLFERVGLFKEGQLNRENAAFSYIYFVLSENHFQHVYFVSGLPSQSSFVQGHFKCSFKSMQSSFENHYSTQHL